MANTSPSNLETDLQRVVDVVVETARPIRIVLFGSSVRGDGRLSSDVDVMVVVGDGTDRHQTTKALYLAMARERFGLPVEFHVTTPSLIERHRDDVGYYHFDAVREGRDLYAA
jgi:predicted nucleotidyltransferase